jgi:hypothetical protein
MQVPEQAGAVTPDGVRTGDPVALAALCDRRGAAVLAYCREVCAPDDAPLAAAEALARFRAAVWACGDAADLDPERLLLSATRHAAASLARGPAEAGTTRRILGRTHTDTCPRMPALIVARAENLLGSADLDRLSRHLDRCSSCRATEAAFRRAERNYVATAHAPLDSATSALFLAALADAAPIEAAAEGEPAPPEPEPAPAPEPVAEELPAAAIEPEPVVDEEHVAEEFEHADDDGWTGEEEPAGDAYEHHMIEPGPATWNATEEPPRRRRGLRVIVPVAVLAAGAVAAMGVAGVFDRSGDSSTVDTRTVQSTSVAPTATTSAADRARQRRARERRRQATNPSTVTATP